MNILIGIYLIIAIILLSKVVVVTVMEIRVDRFNSSRIVKWFSLFMMWILFGIGFMVVYMMIWEGLCR